MNNIAIVGLSGGVDSAVCAFMAKKMGYRVIAIFLHQWEAFSPVTGRCCSKEDRHDARVVADKLDVPFYIMDARKEFKKNVVAPFIEQCLKGYTPNPCVICNEKVKILWLVQKAKEHGAKKVITGHYANVGFDKKRRIYRLYRAYDKTKDQSYFLYRLTQDMLGMLELPLGVMEKAKVRSIAKDVGLPIFKKHDSQQLCFIGEKGVGSFVADNLNQKSCGGEIIDNEGKLLGYHRGIYNYTVGQRRGLGVSCKVPLYISRIDAEKNRIVLTAKKGIYSSGFYLSDEKWVYRSPSVSSTYLAKIRSNHPGAPGSFQRREDALLFLFEEPQYAITPGQSAVFYDGDELIGGGIIKSQP